MIPRVALQTRIFRRCFASAAGKGRTIIRDPRKTGDRRTALTQLKEQHDLEQIPEDTINSKLPFEPQQQNPSLGSYMLAGAGVALGFTLVGLVFGG